VRSRVKATQARSRFGPERVDASGADFSDRLDGNKAFYKTSRRKQRRRRHWNGKDDAVFSDLSDEEEETLDRKLARLRQEVEEVKMELAEKSATTEDNEKEPEKRSAGSEIDDADLLVTIGQLSQALDTIYSTRRGESKGVELDLANTINKFNKASPTGTQEKTVSTAPKQEHTSPTSSKSRAELLQALTQAAEFDGRLAFLEQALGLNGTNMPDQGSLTTKPILHTLDNLDRQVQTISNSSASIDAAQNKTKQLIKDVDRLQKLKQSQEEPNVSTNERSTNDNTQSSYAEDPDRSSKINALYGALPTIDSLAPTLPMVLDRLRTLRLLHTSAAAASSALDEVEKRQTNQAAEIKQWQEALEHVEQSLKSGEGNLTENIKTVRDWVKDLESRMAKLS
jgi:nuclear migration protein JNM1